MNVVPSSNKNTNTKSMKPIVFKIAIIMAAALLLSLLTWANSFDWKMVCFSDQLTCTKNKIVVLRERRDSELANLQEQEKKVQSVIVDRNTYWTSELEKEKLNLPAGYISDMIKKQDFKDVPKGILESVIPKANADNGEEGTASDQTSSPKDSLSTAEDTGATGIKAIANPDMASVTIASNAYAPMRYKNVLTKFGSPYAETPIAQYCKEAGMGVLQCDLLVSIANSESQNGTDFKCTGISVEQAIKLGQNFYFNPVGIKDLRPEGERERSHPDENGCYLRRFDSWDDFWKFYTKHMVKAYSFDKRTEVYSMSGRYKLGNSAMRDITWTQGVNWFVQKINENQ